MHELGDVIFPCLEGLTLLINVLVLRVVSVADSTPGMIQTFVFYVRLDLEGIQASAESSACIMEGEIINPGGLLDFGLQASVYRHRVLPAWEHEWIVCHHRQRFQNPHSKGWQRECMIAFALGS